MHVWLPVFPRHWDIGMGCPKFRLRLTNEHLIACFGSRPTHNRRIIKLPKKFPELKSTFISIFSHLCILSICFKMPSKSRPNSANAKHRPLNATIDRLTRSNDALQLQQQLSGIRLRGRPGSSPGRIWGKGGVLPRVGSLKGKLPVDLSGEVRGEGGEY